MMLLLADFARRPIAGAPSRFALWASALALALSPVLFLPPRPDPLIRGRPGRSYPVS